MGLLQFHRRNGEAFWSKLGAFFHRHRLSALHRLHILQIGELAGKLSDELRADTAGEIDWAAIRGLRNIVAHAYGSVRLRALWDPEGI